MTFTLRVHSSLALAAILLTACSTPEATKTPLPPPAIANPAQRALTVTSENTGAGITLESTQALIVRLPIRATAGLEWSLVDLKPGVLAMQSSKFERALRNAGPGEDNGDVVFRLAPQAAGTVTLNFELRRPHSLLPAVQTVSYDVIVK